jgi:putative FmdB family regulatory protein
VPIQEVGVPTYQYACTVPSCGHRFEAVQTFTEPALTVCPVCDGGLRKVFSPVGVVFKGSGFYRTDSRNSGNGSKKPAASTEKSESSTSSTATKDTGSSSSSSSGSSEGSATPAAKSSGSSDTAAKAAAS